VARCGAICASQQLCMRKRRTTSRAVADLARMARAPVPVWAARSDGRNNDSVLLSRHRRLAPLSVEALAQAMTIREDRAITNVQLWILLWQKQIIDKHEPAGAAAWRHRQVTTRDREDVGYESAGRSAPREDRASSRRIKEVKKVSQISSGGWLPPLLPLAVLIQLIHVVGRLRS